MTNTPQALHFKTSRIKQEWTNLVANKLSRNLSWMFLGQGFSVVCQVIYFILLGRLLGSTEYGIYAGAAALVATFSQVSHFGSHWVLLRYVSVDHGEFAVYWGNVLATFLMFGTFVVVVIAWAGPHFAHSYHRNMLVCVAIGDCLMQLTLGAGRVFQAFEKMQITAGLNLLVNFLRLLTAAVMLFLFRHGTATQWAVAALGASVAATCIGLALVSSHYGRPSFSPRLLWARLSEGFVFLLSYSTAGIYNDIDKAMLGHYGMNAANGVYSMAYRVIDGATIPLISIQGVVFPTFFRKGVDGIRSTAQYAVRLVKRTAPLALLGSLAVGLSGRLLPPLLGKSFSESGLAVLWLCPLPLLRSFHLTGGDALTAAGYQKLRLSTQAAAAAINLGLNLYLIPHYSWRGAAWSSLMTDGLLACFNWAVLSWLAAVRRPK